MFLTQMYLLMSSVHILRTYQALDHLFTFVVAFVAHVDVFVVVIVLLAHLILLWEGAWKRRLHNEEKLPHKT